MKPIFKRLLSGVLSATMTVSAIPIVSAHAEESAEPYPYTMFAASSEDGAITVNAGNFCVNGNVATNGTIVSSGNMNVNGTKTESADEAMIFIFDKIDTQYFSVSNIEEHDDDYSLDEINININVPTEVHGEATLTGNININNALKALEDVNLYGDVKNTNDSVIFSKYGDIVIESQNVNLNGLVYAPFGSVTINAQNLNLNNVVIIAESIELTCPNVNANNSCNISSFVGTASEPLEIPYDEWQYMKDENENDFPDFFENPDNWLLLKDTDGDQLPDCVEMFIGTDAAIVDSDGDMLDDYYEVFATRTNPMLPDTNNNGVDDGDEDFDADSLTNYQEYVQGTSPWNSDSDSDDLSDGDEVNIYSTNPLEPDTDFDGLSDSDEIVLGTNPNLPDTDGDGKPDVEERFAQTYVYDVSSEDFAIEQVIVSMEGSGNLQNTMSVENIMDKDVICSGVVGLVGVPFSIETTSDFETATLSFKIDQSKLGETNFNDLLFLWYDEENYEFVELDTTHDEANGLVSVQTKHFSRYMIVDKYQWYEAWAVNFNYNPAATSPYAPSRKYNTVLAIDCSGSMFTNDPITTIDDIDSPYEASHSHTSGRIKACEGFINNIGLNDKVAIVLFDDTTDTVADFSTNKEKKLLALQKIYSSGGTDFTAAIEAAISEFGSSELTASNTVNRIILLSDGESTASNTVLDKAKGKFPIYTIGLGNGSYDSELIRISNYTGGKFYKALTADELVNLYTNNGFNSDFDTTDTDGDKLYDAVETAGIRLQNGQIIKGCNPTEKDTDNDGLEDGQEIDPTIRWKSKYYYPSDAPDSAIAKEYYFVMNSNPVGDDDTDNDGYSDICDPDPSNTPTELNGQYDFLDNEIYFLGVTDGFFAQKFLDVEGGSTNPGAKLTTYRLNENDNQKFKFEWTKNGYKIHAMNNEALVLTVNNSGTNYFTVSMETDNNTQGQLWEVLPYDSSIDYGGIVIRSKVLCYTNAGDVGKPLFLSYSGETVSVTTEKKQNTRFMNLSIENWLRFGDIYMQHLKWTYPSYPEYDRAIKNYSNNVVELPKILKNNPGYSSYVSSYSKTGCINGQGNFSTLKFADTTFDGVGCEVLATYNAMTRYGTAVDLCKLSAEFEVNAIQITGPIGDGKAGSKPEKIPNCLKSYNLSPGYTDSIIFINPFKTDSSQKDNIKKIQEKLDNNGSVIFSAWNYNDGGVDIKYGVHTVYIEKDISNIIIYNCYNSWTKPETSYTSIDDMFSNSNPLFSTLVIGIWY
jgi:hypothetical protein